MRSEIGLTLSMTREGRILMNDSGLHVEFLLQVGKRDELY